MSAKLIPDGLSAEGISARAFAVQCGVSYVTMLKYCKNGKVFGARKHTLNKQWWIYSPAKLLCEPQRKKQPGQVEKVLA